MYISGSTSFESFSMHGNGRDELDLTLSQSIGLFSWCAAVLVGCFSFGAVCIGAVCFWVRCVGNGVY
jgi:hypothetical protein